MAAPVPSIDRYNNADTSLPAAGLNKTFVVQVDIDFSDPFWAAAGLTNAAGGILIAEAQPGWKLVATASEIIKTTTTNTNPPIVAPVQTASSTATTGGTLAAGTYYYKITALNAYGETIGSNEVSQATTGATSTNTLNWGAVAGATGYRIYRGTVAGGENVYYTVGAVSTYADTNAASTAGSPPAINTTGSPAAPLALGDSAAANNMVASINPNAAAGTVVAGAGADTAKFFTAADGIWLTSLGGGTLQTDGIVRISIAVWAMSDQAFPG